MSEFAKAVELGGFFLAHALQSVVDGPLTSLVGYETGDKRGLSRFAGEEGPQMARQFLEQKPEGIERAVAVVDAFVTYGGVKKDTLLATIVELATGKKLVVGIPYTPAQDGAPFKVHKPKFLETENLENDDLNALGAALFAGVDAHEDGEKIWTAHLDQSF